MSLELQGLGVLELTMAAPLVLRGTPTGTRVLVEFTEVTWSGERLTGRRKGGAAGDWLVIGPEQTALLDIRFMLETHDGALIYVHGGGLTDAANFASGAPMYFAPRFETGDGRYAWLNRVQAIGKGTATGAQARFEMYAAR